MTQGEGFIIKGSRLNGDFCFVQCLIPLNSVFGNDLCLGGEPQHITPELGRFRPQQLNSAIFSGKSPNW